MFWNVPRMRLGRPAFPVTLLLLVTACASGHEPRGHGNDSNWPICIARCQHRVVRALGRPSGSDRSGDAADLTATAPTLRSAGARLIPAPVTGP